MFVRSLKTNIVINIAVVLVVAMGAIFLVLMLVMKKELVNGEIQKATLVLPAIHELLAATTDSPDTATEKDALGTRLEDRFRRINLACMLLVDNKGRDIIVMAGQCDGALQQKIRNQAFKSLSIKKVLKKPLGKTWGALWQEARYIALSLPVEDDFAVGFLIPLDGVYAKLHKLQKIFIFYVFINTFILTLIAFFRLSKIFLGPIQRLAKKAENYQGTEDHYFTAPYSSDELNKLSLSLNSMLDKISKDKKELQNTVEALETVNAELKRAQRDIIRAEKLASIGRLSSGIAHEIGNPIGIILGYIDLIKQGNLSKEEQQDFLTRSEDEINRINNIIRQLLDLSRPMEGKPREISMHQLLLETLEIVKPQPFMAAIQFDTDLVAEKDSVVSDPELLRQVILNLLINAVDAITAEGSQKKGRIHIASRIETLPVDYAPGKKAENIAIAITDNGPGISKEHIDNVFDPFYTTKDPGKGTGLGLSVSFMIIEKLGGTIAADCTATEGTTMRIYLPVASTAEPVHSRPGQNG